jgi:WD40 repeat protein
LHPRKFLSTSSKGVLGLWSIEVDGYRYLHQFEQATHFVDFIPTAGSSGYNDSVYSVGGECYKHRTINHLCVDNYLIVANNSAKHPGVYLWNLETGQRIHSFLADNPSCHFNYTSSGEPLKLIRDKHNKKNLLMVCVRKQGIEGTDDTYAIKVFDLETAECLQSIMHITPICSITTTSHHQVVTLDSDSIIRVGDIESGECTHTLRGHPKADFLAFGNGRLVSGTYDGTFTIWDNFIFDFNKQLIQSENVIDSQFP